MLHKTEVKLKKEIRLKDDFTAPDYSTWKKNAEGFLKGASFDKKLKTKTYEGITLEPLYFNSEEISEVTWPGQEEYRRGTKTEGYLKNTWGRIQKFSLTSKAESLNKIISKEIESGLNAIHLDLNFESTKNLNLKYLNELFNNIDITRYILMLTGDIGVFEFLTLFLIYTKQCQIDPKKTTLILNVDPIAHLVKKGYLKNNFDSIMDKYSLAVQMTDKLGKNSRIIGINAAPFHNGGANIVQQSACTICSAIFYIDELSKRGLDINKIFSHLNFNIKIGPSYFMEIANIRALRIVWSKIGKSFGANTEARKIYINASTSNYFQTVLDPYVNMLRTTTEAFSAVVGGVDNLETGRFSESYESSVNNDEFARRQARNIQLILKEESHLDKIIDPGAGSYYIENLTQQISNKILKEVQMIEGSGGILENLKKGEIQERISEVSNTRLKDLTTRKKVIVGTNMFANPDEQLMKTDQIKIKLDSAEQLRKKESELLKNLKESTNVKTILQIAEQLYSSGANIYQVLTQFNKKELEINSISNPRLTEPFEKIRFAVEKFKKQFNNKIKVFLANYGSLKEYKGRSDFSKSFFEVGGLQVVDSGGFTEHSLLIQEVEKSEAGIIVICSTDQNYPELVSKIVPQIKTKNTEIKVVLAGFPAEKKEEYLAVGVDDFIYMKADVQKILTNILKNIGVL